MATVTEALSIPLLSIAVTEIVLILERGVVYVNGAVAAMVATNLVPLYMLYAITSDSVLAVHVTVRKNAV